MEKQAEYGEKRIVCPLYKLGWIISMNDANRDLIYCDGPACGMYPLCQGRGMTYNEAMQKYFPKTIEIKDKTSVPGL